MTPYAMQDAETDLRAAIDAGDEEAIRRLEPVIDELDVHPGVSLHSAALYYAQVGLHVFPLQPGSKIPFKGSGGFKDATTDPEAIARWWTGNPHANIGIATGHLVDVVDVDGPVGVRSWLTVEDVPTIYGKVSTPRPGGSHLYIAANPARANKAALLPGVDIRASGGYVVAPPSVNAEGVTYYWLRPLDLPA